MRIHDLFSTISVTVPYLPQLRLLRSIRIRRIGLSAVFEESADMKFETKAHYSDRLIRSVTRQFLRRYLGLDYFVALALLAAALVYMISVGDRSWYVGVAGSMLVLGLAVAVAAWVTYHRRAFATLHRMATPEVNFVFDDDGIAFASDLGEGRIKWNALREIWCLSDAWLIFVDRGVYSTLPAECLTGDIREFIGAKTREHGVRFPGQSGSRTLFDS